MSFLGWALIQYDWYPCKKRKFGHRDIQREGDVKTKEDDSHLHAKERGLEQILPSGLSEGTKSVNTSISDFCPPEL